MRCYAYNCRLNCDGECIDSGYVEIDSYGQCTNYEVPGETDNAEDGDDE